MRREKAAERIGAATEELAAGLAQAASAAEELRRSLEQISASAEEAAGAAQESQAAVKSLATVFTEARQRRSTHAPDRRAAGHSDRSRGTGVGGRRLGGRE
jgi:methyl-accepting chemotaxis protein